MADRIAVTAKMNMVDGIRGGIWLRNRSHSAKLLTRTAIFDAIELTEGSVTADVLFRGDVPVDEFARVLPRHSGYGPE